MTEQEMRDSKVLWPKSAEELMEYIESLVKQEHDYGTCVYAISMSAVAAFYYVSHMLGVTGFQASFADLDILRRTRNMERFSIYNFDNLLYPQYRDKFESYDSLIEKNAKWLREKALELLAKNATAHPDVIAHWKMLSNLPVTDKEREMIFKDWFEREFPEGCEAREMPHIEGHLRFAWESALNPKFNTVLLNHRNGGTEVGHEAGQPQQRHDASGPKAQICPTCGGEGWVSLGIENVPDEKCSNCNGTGKLHHA